jgi:hypothetical protein
MSDYYPASPVDLDRLRADLAQAKARVRGLENLLALAERWYGQDNQGSAGTGRSKPGSLQSDKPTDTTPTGPLDKLGAREAAVELLRATGSVWRVDTATREMLRLGWRTESDKPETVVRSAMMREPRIERVAAGRFRYRNSDEPGDGLRPTPLPSLSSDFPGNRVSTENGTRSDGDSVEKPDVEEEAATTT